MKIHFIGIGGIGVSAIARHYMEDGWKASGSDLGSSDITEALKKAGARIIIGEHCAKNIPFGVNKIIYSPAAQEDNPELKEARKIQSKNSNLQILSYPEALGELTKNHFTIAVCGTHGKSTTASMIGLAMIKADKDPSIVVGTKLKELNGSNYRKGKSRYFVIEACEHFASFLNYWPNMIVLTNMEADHLDFYKNLKNYSKAFKEFILRLPKNGILIANKDDKNIQKLLKSRKKWNFKIAEFSAKKSKLKKGKKDAQKLKAGLKVPGEHNVLNGLSSLAAARELSIPDKIIFKSLFEYQGSWRRFDCQKAIFNNKKFILIDDYAHHPSEVRAALKAVREKYPKKEIWCFFQPHQSQRTFLLFKDFVKNLKEASSKKWADKIFITDIYDAKGREDEFFKNRTSAKKLANAIKNKNTSYLPKAEILDFLKKSLKGGEAVLAMGAGDIYQVFHSKQLSK